MYWICSCWLSAFYLRKWIETSISFIKVTNSPAVHSVPSILPGLKFLVPSEKKSTTMINKGIPRLLKTYQLQRVYFENKLV